MKKTVLMWCAAFVVFGAVNASAQAPIKWTERVYNAGAAQPLTAPTDLVVGQGVVCGVDPSTVTASPANPIKLGWDDPTTAGKICVYTDPGTGPLLSTPFGGNYETTLTVTNIAGTSPESVRLPFTHPGQVLPAPTGLKAIR